MKKLRDLFACFFSFFTILSLSSIAQAQSSIESAARQEIEAVLTTSLILNNTQAVSLGTLSFDPSDLLGNLGDQFGTEQSVSRRREITSFNLPARIKLHSTKQDTEDKKNKSSHHLKLGMSFLELSQDISTEASNDPADDYKSRVITFYVIYQYARQWTSRWRMQAEAGLHWQRYENQYGYENTSSQALSGDFDGILFNNSADAAVASADYSLSYRRQDVALPWQWQTRIAYWQGATFDVDQEQASAYPRAWLLSNGIILTNTLPEIWKRKNRLQYTIKRFDLGGDATRVLGADHYYQFAIGWLVKAAEDNSWFNNYGVSLGLNIGSALRGGTFKINYNNEF